MFTLIRGFTMNTTNKFNVSDLNAVTLCSANAYPSVFVATFTSTDECNSYAHAPVLGSPVGNAYGNCSVASYCMSFHSAFTGSLKGFSLTGITAQQFYDATLVFPTAEDCTSAHTQGSISCVYGSVACNSSALIIQGCSSGFGSSFSIPVGELSTFDLLPF